MLSCEKHIIKTKGVIHNLQGDVVGLFDSTGTEVVRYTYDAWRKPLSKTGSLAGTPGTLNLFRYRGYVYDEFKNLGWNVWMLPYELFDPDFLVRDTEEDD